MRAVWFVFVSLSLAAGSDAAERLLRAEVVVEAPIDEVWAAWTTEEGVRRFFAPRGEIDLRVDGRYSIVFFPDAPAGERGAEDMRILQLEPKRRFSFTWNAPLAQPESRAQRTVVTCEFDSLGPGVTRLRLTHWGWGKGKHWDTSFSYFDDAWNRLVLPRFVHAMESGGSIDWTEPPSLKPVHETMVVHYP